MLRSVSLNIKQRHDYMCLFILFIYLSQMSDDKMTKRQIHELSCSPSGEELASKSLHNEDEREADRQTDWQAETEAEGDRDW